MKSTACEPLVMGHCHGRRPCICATDATDMVSGCNLTLLCWKNAAIYNFSAQKCVMHAIFAPARPCCAEKLCVGAIFQHSNALLAHVVHTWCNPSVGHDPQQRTFATLVCKSKTHRTYIAGVHKAHYTCNVHCKSTQRCTVHEQCSCKCTHRYTVHVQRTLLVHSPVHCSPAVYNARKNFNNMCAHIVPCKYSRQYGVHVHCTFVSALNASLCLQCVHCKCTH